MSSAEPGREASAASSSARWRLACDACGAGGAIGPRAEPGARDGWCEACQRGQVVPAGDAGRCERCGGPLSLEAPGFLEAYGDVQELAAVIAAGRGDPAALRALLPERPRFLGDLTPPAPDPRDDAAARRALELLTAGAFAAAKDDLAAWSERAPAEPRAWEARAIGEERRGELAAAEDSWGRAIAAGGSERARLARGALRARRGDFGGAREDLARAGGGREARWNRAALAILEAVATTPGLPLPAVIEAAREEAGPASAYWSDPTVGRLLWSLLVERAHARRRAGAAECPDERVLRAAEAELEHDTFWDRAMVLAGYAALGMGKEAATTAMPLALGKAGELAARPFLLAGGAEAMREAAAATLSALGAGDLARAAAAVAPLAARDDLRQYAVPCAACGRGRLRAEALEEPGAAGE